MFLVLFYVFDLVGSPLFPPADTHSISTAWSAVELSCLRGAILAPSHPTSSTISRGQVYTGVKCVRFRFTKEISEGVLMGIGVLWLNAMVWALTQLVAEATMEEGILEPSLHPHR